jgi:hypothetical protein
MVLGQSGGPLGLGILPQIQKRAEAILDTIRDREPSSSGSMALLVNQSAGPVSVTLGGKPVSLQLEASGGTPGGPAIVWVNTGPRTAGGQSTAVQDAFGADGNFLWTYNVSTPGNLFFAVQNGADGEISNWVEVEVTS